jgi:hypothetical protein
LLTTCAASLVLVDVGAFMRISTSLGASSAPGPPAEAGALAEGSTAAVADEVRALEAAAAATGTAAAAVVGATGMAAAAVVGATGMAAAAGAAGAAGDVESLGVTRVAGAAAAVALEVAAAAAAAEAAGAAVAAAALGVAAAGMVEQQSQWSWHWGQSRPWNGQAGASTALAATLVGGRSSSSAWFCCASERNFVMASLSPWPRVSVRKYVRETSNPRSSHHRNKVHATGTRTMASPRFAC